MAVNPETGRWEVGHRAREIAVTNPRAAIYSIKRFIGRRFQEDTVQKSLHRYLYEIAESRRRPGAIQIEVGHQHLTPQEASAKVLQKLKEQAERALGREITQAVITVPAYFHDSQRQATRDAGRIAGLDVQRVLNEPTAACLAFGFRKLAEERKTVAVYDLGGGTFDIAILDIGRGPFRVRATNGDTFLGGDDLNWMIVEWTLAQIGGEEARKLHDDVEGLAHLRDAAEHAKIALSQDMTADVTVPGPLSAAVPISDLKLPLARHILDQLAHEWIAKTLRPCEQALRDAQMKASDMHDVLLVGGQTRMVAVRIAVRDFFGHEPNVSVNPEEVVALGAAVQAAILAGEATGLKLADVVPLSLGVNTKGSMDIIIRRNTPVPIRRDKMYTTAEDNQDTVKVQICQGEHPLVDGNTQLGSFFLKDILPAPAGEPEIKVTFQVDQDGILMVSATDLRTDVSAEITITDTIKLSEEEIADAIREAEQRAEEYATIEREAEQRHLAEQLTNMLHKLLAEHTVRLPAALVVTVRDALTAPDSADLSQHIERLRLLAQQVGDMTHRGLDAGV